MTDLVESRGATAGDQIDWCAITLELDPNLEECAYTAGFRKGGVCEKSANSVGASARHARANAPMVPTSVARGFSPDGTVYRRRRRVSGVCTGVARHNIGDARICETTLQDSSDATLSTQQIAGPLGKPAVFLKSSIQLGPGRRKGGGLVGLFRAPTVAPGQQCEKYRGEHWGQRPSGSNHCRIAGAVSHHKGAFFALERNSDN
jgi:hypothetical protein